MRMLRRISPKKQKQKNRKIRPMSKEESSEYKSRLREMTAVLHKHGITRGVTPEKLRLILEDLGPTYIKIGQIMSMHSDILPKRYCEELMRLCSEVAPMSFEEVEEILQDSYGMDWREIFQNIEEKPLGSASIAQVMMDLMDVMKENKIIMPHGLTMLARGLTHIEGILADISPDINMIGIAATRIKGDLLNTMDWKKELKKNGKLLYRSLHKGSIEFPALLSEHYAWIFERADKGKFGFACIQRTGTVITKAHSKHCYGAMGYGIANQFQHYLYHRYET